MWEILGTWVILLTNQNSINEETKGKLKFEECLMPFILPICCLKTLKIKLQNYKLYMHVYVDVKHCDVKG
jgi:hypothetical protein